jgi:GH35 family endo-1,4-beta-xylanase
MHSYPILEVHITELDISLNDDSAASLEKQATLYADLVTACLSVPMCRNFETWGFTVRHASNKAIVGILVVAT